MLTSLSRLASTQITSVTQHLNFYQENGRRAEENRSKDGKAVILFVAAISFYLFLETKSSFVKTTPINVQDADFLRSQQRIIECASHVPIKEIIIKGERHCGTNWVRTLLEKNVHQDVTIDANGFDIGWKHGFLPPLGWGRPMDASDVLVVVTRDVFTWLPKMFKEPYDAEMGQLKVRKKVPFHKYIASSYRAKCHPNSSMMKRRPRSTYQINFLKSFTDDEKMFDRVAVENAANLIHIRTAKYKNWLSNDPAIETYDGSSKEDFLRNRIHVRMEDLTIDNNDVDNVRTQQYKTVIEPAADRCVRVKEHFEPLLAHTKWHTHITDKRNFHYEVEKRQMLAYYSKEELRFVLSQLDMEFEESLGYNYDYVYELLESDDFPETHDFLPTEQKRLNKIFAF